MKVILLKEVKGLGRAGEVKVVSDGYAQNFLFPQVMATIASERNVDVVGKKIKKKKEEKAKPKGKKKK